MSVPLRPPFERMELIRLLRSGGVAAVGLVVIYLVVVILPAATAVVVGWIVDRVETASADAARGGSLTSGGELGVVGPVLSLISVIGFLILLSYVADVLQPAASFAVARRIDGVVRARIRSAAASYPGLAELERSETQDDFARASNRGGFNDAMVGRAAVGQLWVVLRLGGAILCAVLLADFSLVLVLVMVVATLLARSRIRRYWLELEEFADSFAGHRRRAAYWMEISGGAAAAKEVRIFGLSGWSVDRQFGYSHGWLRQMWARRRDVVRRQWYIFVLLAVVTGGFLIWLAVAAMRGELTPGELSRNAMALLGLFAMSAATWETFDIEHGVVTLRALRRLRPSRGDRPSPNRPATPAPQRQGPPEIRFEHVSFRYPGADRHVLDDIDLRIASGEVVAIVGANGAGKTTLIKLLSGLYSPTGGRILVDGVDVGDIDHVEWRARITAVFQDFNRYELSVRENITLASGVFDLTDEECDSVLQRAGLSEIVAKLPHGSSTILSRGYADGAELSGGQWQRVAVARAIAGAMKSDVVILDEPTAHMDVHSEVRFFENVLQQSAGKTVLLISHRLSTVRRADRIVLIDSGRVAEVGTQDELLASGGQYARMFEAEARHFAADGVLAQSAVER